MDIPTLAMIKERKIGNWHLGWSDAGIKYYNNLYSATVEDRQKMVMYSTMFSFRPLMAV